MKNLKKNINSLFDRMMRNFVYLDPNCYNTNKSRIPAHTVWDTIRNNYYYNVEDKMKLSMLKKKEYKKDIVWLSNRLEEHIKEVSCSDIDLLLKELRELYINKYTKLAS